jgi:hypothetical protein
LVSYISYVFIIFEGGRGREGERSYMDGALGATFRRLLKKKGKRKKNELSPSGDVKEDEKRKKCSFFFFFLWGLEEGGVEDAWCTMALMFTRGLNNFFFFSSRNVSSSKRR